MKVTHTATYDAPAADVYAMLTDQAYREYAAKATGVVSASVKVEDAGGRQVVTVDQVQPTEGVPSFAKKFAGDTTRAILVETWASPSAGTVTVETPGRPTEISGTYRLVELGGRTTLTFEGEVKAKVPLIGGKLEGLMAQLFLEGKDKEQAAGVAWLAGDRG